jgi:hypothetical protein
MSDSDRKVRKLRLERVREQRELEERLDSIFEAKRELKPPRSQRRKLPKPPACPAWLDPETREKLLELRTRL